MSPIVTPTATPTASPTVSRRKLQVNLEDAYDDKRFDTLPASCVPDPTVDVEENPDCVGDNCCYDVCFPEIKTARGGLEQGGLQCLLDIECGAVASDELAANREAAVAIGGRCINGYCECALANPEVGQYQDGRYGYGCGDCSIDMKVLDEACNNQPTNAARFLRNASIFDQCDPSLKAGFTSDVCERGEYLFDDKVWESEIDGSCGGNGQCLEIRFEDEQCVCNRGYVCPDCSLSLLFDVQLFGAKCGDYVNGNGFCRENADCYFSFDDRDAYVFEVYSSPLPPPPPSSPSSPKFVSQCC
jgi:hypothetical protein